MLLMILYVLITPQAGHAQGTINDTWSNEFSFPTGHHIEELNDTCLITVYGAKDIDRPGRINFQVKVSDKRDLSEISSFVLENVYHEKYIFRISNRPSGCYIFTVVDSSDHTTLKMFKLTPSLNEAQVMFHAIDTGDVGIVNVELIDNEVYVIKKIESTNTVDSSAIFVYDTNGGLLRQRIFNRLTASNQKILTSVYTFGPYQHPLNTNEIVLGNQYRCQTISIDKNTLLVKEEMPEEPFTLDYLNKFILDYAFTDSFVACGGHASKFYGPVTNPQSEWQFYFHSRKWNGDSIAELDFGSLDTAQRAKAYKYDKRTDYHYLAGSSPFEDFRLDGPEFRKVVIYKFNDSSIDTLRLFGQKNHVPSYILTDQHGSLYLLSTYSDFQSNNLNHYQLTKIADFAISLIEQKKVSNQIYLYPNPAREYISFEGVFENIEKLEFYTQSGKKVKEVQPTSKRILVEDLQAGLYVIIVRTTKGDSYTSMLSKI